ncbi:hypothetical protein P7C71_g3794, partial [Lecanoromycetidae sp. Uapishka_2]
MLAAALLVVGAAWQFSMLAGQQWAADRGIGIYPGYSIYQYAKDIPPVCETLPPYWVSRLAERHASGLDSTATPNPESCLPLEGGFDAAEQVVETVPIEDSLTIEQAATDSEYPSKPVSPAPAPRNFDYRLSLLLALLFAAKHMFFKPEESTITAKTTPPKLPTVTKKAQQELPTELELSTAIAIPIIWYAKNTPLPASPVEARTYASTSMGTQTVTPQLAPSPLSVVVDSPPTNNDATSASIGRQKTTSQLGFSTISTVLDLPPTEPSLTTSTRMQTESGDRISTLEAQVRREIESLQARNQQLDATMDAKLVEIAKLRAALTMAEQQVRQAEAQGFVINQEQYRGSGYPNGNGGQGGWRKDYRRGGGPGRGPFI